MGKQAEIITFDDTTKEAVLRECVPPSVARLRESQSAIPKLAKDAAAIRDIEAALPMLPTRHEMRRADARAMDFIPSESVHLILTSPPYWTLK